MAVQYFSKILILLRRPFPVIEATSERLRIPFLFAHSVAHGVKPEIGKRAMREPLEDSYRWRNAYLLDRGFFRNTDGHQHGLGHTCG